ncbi:FAD-binding oxidoreductase [Rhodoferax sp. GW822-FHT02A01]|uniref:NAD(P)/FAD-dependent oxidoreductase n=1 Tax=Rhodoferax sp. GW822-FHT02A01 TaxID=3141537 RepID=UPI00315DB185
MTKKTVIIGGGGVGSSIASFLSSTAPDEAITVIERDPTYQTASSSLSASSIRHQFSTPVSIELSKFGYEFMRGCSTDGKPGSGVGLTNRGYLFLGTQTQAPFLRSRTATVLSMGGTVQEFDKSSLSQRYPWLNVEDIEYASEGTYGEGWFDGYMLQQWYRTTARSNGVNYIKGEAVGFETNDSRVTKVILGDGTAIECDRVINACGAWSASLAKQLGLTLPIHAKRRTIFVVSTPQHIENFPILIDSSGIFIRPEQHHFICTVVPEESEDHDDLPLDPDFSLFEERIWPTLAERIPQFEALRVERAWAGYYEVNILDQNGLVGKMGPENHFVAAGFSGHGLMQSAGVGRGMAELLQYGEFRSIDLAPLSPERLQTGRLIVEDAVY